MNHVSRLDSIALQWIDNYYHGVLEHPEMYASSPMGLEDVINAIESMRHSILSSNTTRTLNPYQEFLLEKGFGSASFTYRMTHGVEDTKRHESVLFAKYAAFLHEYLASQSRLHSVTNPHDSL
jgi:hypothetical protein